MSLSGSGDTGSGSAEVSVPTDLTVTSEADSEEAYNRRYAREIHSLKCEKVQLQQVVEKLRLELQGRDSQLLASKSRYDSLLNQKETQLGIRLSEKQVIINRLEAENRSCREELHLLKERAAKELAHLLEKCSQFQQKQERFAVKHDEVKSSLSRIQVSEVEYQRLRSLPQEELNLQQFSALRVYEIVVPLKLKIREVESIKSSLENTLNARERQLENFSKENTRLEHEISSLNSKLINSVTQCEELRNELKQDDYRIHNFDRVKRERDKCEEERERLTTEKAEFELAASVYKKEKEVLEERLAELKTKQRHQEIELSRYQGEYREIRAQLDKGKDDATKSYSMLKTERERSEDFHEKYLKSRMEIISLTEQLKDSQIDLKALSEKFSMAVTAEKESKDKYNRLLLQYEQLSHEMESLQTKYLKEKDLAREEIRELKANYNSMSQTYNSLQAENMKLQKESQVSKLSQQEKVFSQSREMLDLQREVGDLKQKLEVYKSLENDYLSTLRAFATIPSQPSGDSSRDRSGIPAFSIIQGKLSEETVALTRRILNLERLNVEACTTIQSLTSALDKMRVSIASYKAALSMAGKPSSQLLERISSQEEQILALEVALKATNETKQSLIEEVGNLKEKLEKASKYIEKADVIRTEVADIQREILNIRKIISDNDGATKQTVNKNNVPSAIKITKQHIPKR